MCQKNIVSLAVIPFLIGIVGCQNFHHAEISGNKIIDPKLGWNGYEVTISDNYSLIPIDTADTLSGPLKRPVSWLFEKHDIFTLSLHINFYEHFFFQSNDQESYILFSVERFSLSTPFNHYSSVDKTYIRYNIRDCQKVRLNDSDAVFELVDLNGMSACRVSGQLKPYYRKEYPEIFYEGYLFLGHLNEVFWVEGISSAKGRAAMQRGVEEMAKSLKNPI